MNVRWVTVGREFTNEAIVRQGWALAYRRYSRAYVSAEDEARKSVVGIWRGKFVEPWEWRRGRPGGT